MTDSRRPAWSEAPTEVAASAGEVHVWRAGLDREPDFVSRLSETLAPEERERADRFRFPRDREHFIVARGVLREILGRYLDRDSQSLRFETSPYGKPSFDPRFAPSPNVPNFNISHSGGLVLCAITRSRDIGVDIERIRADVEVEEIAKRFFSQSEVAALQALPSGARREGFFTCWTRKEAYIKARGEGLSMPLDQFDVTLAPGSAASLLATRGEAADAEEWTLRELTPGEGYVGAVAVRGGRFALRCFGWTPV